MSRYAILPGMRHLSEETYADLETALRAEKAAVEEELAEHGRPVGEAGEEDGEWAASSSGLEGEEADPTDVADQIEELVTNVPLVKELEDRRRDIRDALRKIKEGNYGICEIGGDEIDLDRLEANPAARTCIEHAE